MKKILVIDDDKDIGLMIKMILEYKGYKVIVLENPQPAEEILKNDGIDLIIMDMLLSGVNGIDICKKIKNNISISNIPLIMMSAHPDANIKCLNAGADDFILKPFDMQHLLSTINKFIEIK